MKILSMLLASTGILLLSNNGYTQLGNLRNKIDNAANKVKNKTETTENKTAENKIAEKKPDTITTAMANDSNIVNSKYFLNEDLKLISGATFYFSNQPFTGDHEGAKKIFKSSDFIYGRLELTDQTIEEAFKLTPIGKNYYLLYDFAVVDGDEGRYAQTFHSAMMISPADIKKKTLNFDLLPDPTRATTGIGMKSSNNFDGFDVSHVTGGPMYEIIDPSKFPRNGAYTVQLQFYFQAKDDWGNESSHSSDWPGAEGAFQFTLNTGDVAAIKKNFTAVQETVRTAAFTLHAMPDSWPKISRTLPDAALSAAALEKMIKAELSSSGDVLVKFVVAHNSPNTLWIVQKNDVGIPTYQLLSENIYTIYKREGKCFLGDVSIAKEYLGGGKYGNPYVRNVNFETSGYGTAIDCSVIK